MDTAAARLIEKLVDHGACAALTGAAAFAGFAAFGQPAAPLLAGALAYPLCWLALSRIAPAVGAAPLGELMLDQPLIVPAGESRVVRLFDPTKMPADRPSAAVLAPSPDASQALRDALSELRRSLR
ncbi:MAG: hypothetical protein ABIS38_09785 [Sphingomicrobium sp.]